MSNDLCFGELLNDSTGVKNEIVLENHPIRFSKEAQPKRRTDCNQPFFLVGLFCNEHLSPVNPLTIVFSDSNPDMS